MPPETFFQYLDDSGALVLVDRLEKVPEGLRDRVKRLELPAREAEAVKGALETLERLEREVGGGMTGLRGQVEAFARDPSVEPVSFGLGFLGATLLGVGFWVVRGSVRLVLKVVALLLLAGLFAGFYFGYVRSAAGLAPGTWTNPRQLLEDARGARERLDERHDSTQKELEVVSP